MSGAISLAIESGRMARLRARGISETPAPLLPEEGFAYWCAEIKRRVATHYDNVILITGDVGSGKSTLGLRVGEACDPTFSADRLAYGAEALLGIYKTVRVGQVVVFDEGVRGMYSGDNSTPEQKAIVKALALVREKGAVLIVCAPSIWLIAPPIRGDRATLWVHVIARGTAIVHERRKRISYKREDDLGFIRSRRAGLILWDPYRPTARLWTAYLAAKHAQLDEFLIETEEMLRRKRGAGPKDEAGTPEDRAAEAHRKRNRDYYRRKKAKEQ